ncbi:hypothetical protein GCM10010399_63820 [Dactylosporangium fulvum]|uniref:Uncharacterized protein n=1 Tax=Dactylosporangium fulvum TaxID=53359 RepID=A0ABY5W703_9ACTN|nr:hypothetical protein [Dactylosporangium fulvum]UWP85795.1 hypothetical protein Dfulv_16745 [Dactylosporangium fulvum]
MSDTVKIRVEIDIHAEGTHDTERAAIGQRMWDTESQSNNGGIWVETDGAESL